MTKKIRVWWSGDTVMSEDHTTITVDLTDVDPRNYEDAIEEAAKDEAFNHIAWGWDFYKEGASEE